MATIEASAGLELSERAELDWLLQSGVLGRSVNLTKVLRYVCEEAAAGRGDRIKEYSIAVEALGRKPNFDPQTDTIVRVTFHTLRKRLHDIYDTGEGMSHAVRIVIPAGGYAAQFIDQQERVLPAIPPNVPREEAVSSAPVVGPIASPGKESQPPSPVWAGARVRWILLAALLAGFLMAVTLWRALHQAPSHRADSVSAARPVTISGSAYILFGNTRHPYTDHSGVLWEPQPACEGGEALPSTGGAFSGTEDSYIYDGGLRGIVRCTFHARPGLYELRIHFAEPGNLEPAHRVVSLSVNAGPALPVDVVDRAGADRAATTFTIPGVSPENDGTIHLDFTSEVSPVNAVEILPAPAAEPLPLRIVAASTPVKDDSGNVWLSDRYFRGGRHGQPPDQEHRPSLGLYASGRIGTFQYSLPAPTGRKYKVTLYFREPWFGQENGAPGGAGSRVFDVFCNGQAALRNFDILAEGHGNSVTRTIDGVSPTAQSVLNLQFIPVVNYPLVNAIEVTPEQP
jgi:Malectin domain